jgi:YcaO-like protein with predicted kinase domain
LLEAVEIDCAERTPPPPTVRPLEAMGDALEIWSRAPRHPLGVRLDPAVRRGWVMVTDVATGVEAPAPWDMLSLDMTRELPRDVRPATVGLATGNSQAEACVAAIGELLEHHFQASTRDWQSRDRRAAELDLTDIEDATAAALVRHIRSRGFAVRAWSMAQDAGVAAFCCAVTDLDPARPPLPPAGGTACHPVRAVAFVRALLEAVQSRVTLIAGARDDLTPDDYDGGAQRTADLVLHSLSFGPGPLAWSAVPDFREGGAEAQLDRLVHVAAEASRLPIYIHSYEPPAEGLHVVRALAPGLGDLGRVPPPATKPPPPAAPMLKSRLPRRPVVFAGPSLPRHLVPDGIELRPPAMCGDLVALLDERPPAVGLIDGSFETAPTVWHKEIMHLISEGIPVCGGASLGALRAAELHAFGMVGVGRIFEHYRDGAIVRDDAVMLVHAPAELDFRAMTVAQVDAEAALVAAGLPAAERRQLQRIVRTTDFRQRTWEICLDRYRARTGLVPSCSAERLGALATLKLGDARQLVEWLGGARPRLAHRPRVPMTALYRLMLERRSQAPRPDLLPANGHALPA